MSDFGQVRSRLTRLYDELDDRFDRLAYAAGLDPQSDFQFRDLRSLRFANADLRDFDFRGSDLRGTELRRASIVDHSTKLYGVKLDEEDQQWVQRRNLEFGRHAEEGIILAGLRGALDRREFSLVFQPKFSLRDNKMVGAEVLLRWHHPQQGIISPDRFIPLLESASMIESVTYWVIETVIERQRKLVDFEITPPFSINISPSLICDVEFITNCLRIMRESRLGLRFELFETALILDFQLAVTHMKELSRVGVSFALDNFGVGYSSLSHLGETPFTEIKIDRSYINRLPYNSNDAAIVYASCSLAHDLGMKCTAVGIENQEQLTMLRALGCDFAQGYFLSRPLDYYAFEAALQSESPDRGIVGSIAI